MTGQSDHEIAERLMRRRARLVPVLAVLFIAGQAIYFGNPTPPVRPVDTARIAAWLAWAVALLMLLATGGGLFRSAGVRALINDETTRDHRARAMAFGFWAAMLMCVFLYFFAVYEPVTAREAIHLVLTAGVGGALIRFGMLERRALREHA